MILAGSLLAFALIARCSSSFWRNSCRNVSPFYGAQNLIFHSSYIFGREEEVVGLYHSLFIVLVLLGVVGNFEVLMSGGK